MALSVKLLFTIIVIAVTISPSFAALTKCSKKKCASILCIAIAPESCAGTVAKAHPCDCCSSCIPGPTTTPGPTAPSSCEADICQRVRCAYVDQAQCTNDGNVYVKNGGMCACCDACNPPFLDIGENCQQYANYAVPPQCVDGTECDPNSGTCQYV